MDEEEVVLTRQQHDKALIELHAGDREAALEGVICMECETHRETIPLGHQCACETCRVSSGSERCPVCRCTILSD
eukprot:768604-Hanusia_phi.AAC.3